MYHSIAVRHTCEVDDLFILDVTFKTSDIKEISIERDQAGLPTKGWLVLSSIMEEGGSSSFMFTRETSQKEIELLDALSKVLQSTPSYYEDTQSNIFPFDKILYVNSAKCGFVLAPGIEISLHPTDEWPVFTEDYKNWLDLTK